MIRIRINVESAATVKMLQEKGPQLVRALTQRVTRAMIKLQQKIVNEKLSGQVLARRSGLLAGSVHVEPTTNDGTTILGFVTSSAGPAWYGRVHEYGGMGTYVINPVDKKALRFMMGGKEVFAKYVFHPPLPARPFMGPSLEESIPEIRADLNAAVREVVSE